MASYGFSNYHSLLANAVKRRAIEYFCMWNEKNDDAPSPQWELINEERMVLAVLLTTYIEAVANLLLALQITKPDLFNKVEKRPLIEKWTLVPAEFIGGYEFPAKGSLRQDLEQLIERRRAIVHMKPQVSFDGKPVHEGNAFSVSPEDHEMVIRWLTLPGRLVDQVG